MMAERYDLLGGPDPVYRAQSRSVLWEWFRKAVLKRK